MLRWIFPASVGPSVRLLHQHVGWVSITSRGLSQQAPLAEDPMDATRGKCVTCCLCCRVEDGRCEPRERSET